MCLGGSCTLPLLQPITKAMRGQSTSHTLRILLAGAIIVTNSLAARIYAQGSTPWEFLGQVGQAETLSQRFGLIFVSVVMMWLYLGRLRLLLPIILLALVVLAIAKPGVRRSRLVRTGFALFIVGLLPLLVVGIFVTDNPVGLGMLFAFFSVIGLSVVFVGVIVALLKSPTTDTVARSLNP
jgi:hypothetical protein